MKTSFAGFRHLIARAVLFLLVLLPFSVNAQNPTVINDSLVVNQRVYAKEKLVVDKEAKFKEDIKVLGTARISGDLIVDGTAKLNSNVKMEGLGELTGLATTDKIIVVLPNGQLKTTTVAAMNEIIYAPFLCTGGDVPNPQWSSGLNKIYSACDIVRVGIGTTAPDHKLHVVGVNYAQKFLAGNVGATTDALLNLYCQNNSQDLIQVGIKIGGLAQEMRFVISNDGAINIKNVGTEPTLTINNGTGHALVAYSNSGTKILQLEDNGMMRAREIKVDEVAWPDYVFDQNYKLPKLKDVANFIDKNHHLPGVPAASEIEGDGLNLGEMQKIHMQKIEELTLYLIDMDEKMAAMEKRMEELEKENAELKKSSK